MLSRLLKSTIILSIILLLTGCEEPEPTPSKVFMNTFGGDSTDKGNWVEQTTDGGYIIVGSTNSYGAGESDVWLIKTDAFGDTVWTSTFGGLDMEFGRSIQQTADGGYIITGGTSSYGDGARINVWLVKTDSSGNELWTKAWGGAGYDTGRSVQQTIDGGYIIIGDVESFGVDFSDAWLIKTDAEGGIIWWKFFGEYSPGQGRSVQQTTDGGYIIAGTTDPAGRGVSNVWLIKTDASGDSVWTKTFGGSYDSFGYSIQQTTDGGYIIVGTTDPVETGVSDVWLIKTDASGDTLWTRTFGGSASDQGRSVQQTSDGGYIITGWTSSFGAGSEDVWLVKTDTAGEITWTRTFGGGSYDHGNSVQQTDDGGYIIAGYTRSYGAGWEDILLIKTDEYGNVD